ncbi:MAG TPA: tetratricopeptide repeat protein [Candidatus Sulfopaludibacter sp.]|jgi:tetratricopeptide (TPR) repeat protein|nr:tetratricopeptide repeat protein [Candidatus Sulfopaludibacter sp.]
MMRWCATLCLAAALASAADYAHTVEDAERAAAAFHSGHDPRREAEALDVAGSAHLHRGEYDLALARYRSALALDRRNGDSSGAATRLTNIGSVYFFQGRYFEALAEYQQALRGGGDRSLVLRNLAALYDQLGETSKALDYYQQAVSLKPSGALLAGMAALYRRTGDTAAAIKHFRRAQELDAQAHLTSAETHDWEDIGVTSPDPNSALAAFDHAVNIAGPQDLPLAHLFRGEALFRLKRTAEAAPDFHAAGGNWLALYRLGDLPGALAARDTPLPDGFFPPKRELYNAAITQALRGGITGPKRLFLLFEQTHESPVEGETLDAVQARLSSSSLLVEEWEGDGQHASLWATKDRAGIAASPADYPLSGISQILLVSDGETAPTATYLPYASLLVRDEPWRTPLLPWQAQRLDIRTKQDLYTRPATILIFHNVTTVDATNPNRAHIQLSPTEALFRGEIVSLPLTQTDLVILPAPDPAHVLSRALLAAGARSVLTTLHPISETAAATFLKRLNTELARGKSKAGALHDAQSGSPPVFVLAGNGQEPVRAVLSWAWLMGPALGAILAIAFRRRVRAAVK